MKFIAPDSPKDHPAAVLKIIKTYWTFRLATWTLVAGVIGSLAAIVWLWHRLPPAVPLWYSRPWGVDRLAHPVFLFILLWGDIVIYFVNIFVSIRLIGDHPTFVKTLLLTSALINTLSLVVIIRILTLVT